MKICFDIEIIQALDIRKGIRSLLLIEFFIIIENLSSNEDRIIKEEINLQKDRITGINLQQNIINMR